MPYNLKCCGFNELEESEKANIKSLDWMLFSDKQSVSNSNFEGSYVVYDNNVVVAMLSLDRLGDVVYIYHFEVLKRRQGYGRQIINDLKSGLTNIKSIVVDAKDMNSYLFWTSIGFVPRGDDLYLGI